jgi:hypothetical protein
MVIIVCASKIKQGNEFSKLGDRILAMNGAKSVPK